MNQPFINRNEFDVPLEFEVWGKIVKDIDGKDIQVFIKEDKARGVRRDSSFYWDGGWEVMETDNGARTVRSKTSHGVETTAEYDDTWHINKFYLVNKTDTVTNEQYFWKNGKLIKTKINGLERIFIYGKTLQDTVKVFPSDEGLYFHRGYNNSVGIIPDEIDPMYKYFARDPYSGIYASNSENTSLLKKEVPMLFKDNYITTTSSEFSVIRYNPPFTNSLSKYQIYPDGTSNGRFDFGFYFGSECRTDTNGCSYVNYESRIDDKVITLYESFLVYKNQKWQRYCRSEERINATYNHELKHIDNAENRARWLPRSYMPTRLYSTKKECDTERMQGELLTMLHWSIWSRDEYLHENLESPQPTPFILERICDEYKD